MAASQSHNVEWTLELDHCPSEYMTKVYVLFMASQKTDFLDNIWLHCMLSKESVTVKEKLVFKHSQETFCEAIVCK